MSMSEKRAATRYVLHLNLNTTALEAAGNFYTEVFGLEVRMKSSGDDGDWRFHGIPDPVSSAAWFLYDGRGPRVSPALEIIQWRKPATRTEVYPDVAHRGMSAVTFRVPTLDGLAERALAAGGQVVGELADAGVLLRDPDGAYVEVRPDAQLPGSRLAAARIGCADLDASLRFFDVLGFDVTSPPRDGELTVGNRRRTLRSASVALPSASVDLVLTQWLDPVADEPPHAQLWTQGFVRMAISVDDLDEALAVLRDRGIETPEPQTFGMEGTKTGALTVVFLTDPDGFTVELVHRPPRYFGSS